MKPVTSTAEILAFKALNRNINKQWIDWAFDMLMAGFDTENLAILAGEYEPYNQFELQKLMDKILIELEIDYSDKDKIIKDYVGYLIDKGHDGVISNMRVLEILKNLCIELGYEKYLYDFYALYFAKDDLKYAEIQNHWDVNVNRNNIDNIIEEYFVKWKVENVSSPL